MYLGTSYYPELNDPAEWERDLDLMKSVGLSVIRMLDFAWTSFEPREGEYDFEWLDRFLDMANARDLKVILCTPTATPPPWLSRQYPQIMVELRSGERRSPGARRDVCVNSTIYRHYCVNLARLLGERYGSHPAVIGWQVDNELMGPEGAPPECHCPECYWRFRGWLKRRYASIDEINHAWGLGFWCQKVSDWGEIGTPRHRGTSQHQVLDYARFFSDSQLEFLRLQYDALRAVVDQRQFVTTNSTGVFNRGINHIDYHKLTDVAGWDAYVGAAGQPFPLAYASLAHDLMRSAKHKQFLVMETGGAKGALRAFLAEMRAHGAAGAIFWHWRRHRFNRESGPNALCDYAGRPVRGRMEAFEGLLDELAFDDDLPDELPRRRGAFVMSYDNSRFDIRRKQGPADYLEAIVRLYEPLWRIGAAVDVVEPGDSLEGYDFVAAPSLALISDEQASGLRNFVERGGVLLANGPLAHRHLNGHRRKLTGEVLREVVGAEWVDAHARGTTTACFGDGKEQPIEGFAECLRAETADVLATFTDGAAAGMPAVLRNSFGKGQTWYIGCVSHALARAVAADAAKAAGLPVVEHEHEMVSVLPHLTGKGTWYFNHGDDAVEVNGHKVEPGNFRHAPDA